MREAYNPHNAGVPVLAVKHKACARPARKLLPGLDAGRGVMRFLGPGVQCVQGVQLRGRMTRGGRVIPFAQQLRKPAPPAPCARRR